MKNPKVPIKETKKYKRTACDDIKDHYKESFNTAISELKFEKMNVDFLRTTLEEIETLTKDVLIKTIIWNMLERHELDKQVHARILFNH